MIDIENNESLRMGKNLLASSEWREWEASGMASRNTLATSLSPLAITTSQ